jgi:hypothetical protein
MPRRHALIISLFLGLAALAGTIAATRTAQLGSPAAASAGGSSAALQRRTQLLDRQEAALHRALAKRPPKLPRVPTFAAQRAAATPRVRFVRPAPVVVVTHGSHGDEGEQGEHEHEGSDD